MKWDRLGVSNSVSGGCFSGEIFCFLASADEKPNLLREIIGFEKNKSTDKSYRNIAVNGKVYAYGYDNGCLLDPMADEFLYNELTVNETLNFHNAMRVDYFDNRANIYRLLNVIKLDLFKDVMVKDLSPDQRRLLTIAIDIVIGSDCIIYEDVSVGLTSLQTINVLTILRKIVKEYNPQLFVILGVSKLSLEELHYIDRIQVISNVNTNSSGSEEASCQSLYYGTPTIITAFVNDCVKGVVSNIDFVKNNDISMNIAVQLFFATHGVFPGLFTTGSWKRHVGVYDDTTAAAVFVGADGTEEEGRGEEEEGVDESETPGAVASGNSTHSSGNDGTISSPLLTDAFNEGKADANAPIVKPPATLIRSTKKKINKLSWYYNKKYDHSLWNWTGRLGRQANWCLWRAFVIRLRTFDAALFAVLQTIFSFRHQSVVSLCCKTS